MTVKIGDRVRVTKMPEGSFYTAVEGIVTSVFRGTGWVSIDADTVKSKWDKDWQTHPTTCSISAKIENVKVIA